MGKNIKKEEKRTPYGFGHSSPRWPKVREDCTLGPGQYNPKSYECAYKKGSSWARKREVEEFSKNLGYRNAHILEERKFWRSQGGPGNYDISEYVYKQQTSSTLNNVSFGHGDRFQDPVKHDAPPPNTYFLKNIPDSFQMKQFTSVPPFEWDGFVDRFKGKKTNPLPPNQYNPVDFGSLQYMLNKKVSKRGPYDLFTGPRDETTIKNYFAPPIKKGYADVVYNVPTNLDLMLKHHNKQGYGKFLRGKRFPKKPTIRMLLTDVNMCYKDPNHPSPAHYDIAKWPKEIKQNDHPFNMSVKKARPKIEWRIFPGPGRYDPAHPKCSNAKTGTWLFKSKANRDLYKIVNYSDF